MPLSITIIARNAASQLDGCLASVAFADEVVVVDSGSTDNTVELAKRRGARVIAKEWLGFGPQKQFAVESASHDWVLCLDADERLSETLRESIIAELKAPRAWVYAMPRCNRFLGRWLRHGEGYPDWSVRLFHRGACALERRRRARKGRQRASDPAPDRRPFARLGGNPGEISRQAEPIHQPAGAVAAFGRPQREPPALAGFAFVAVRQVLPGAPRILDGVPGLVHIAIGCMNTFNKYAKLKALERTSK